MRCRGHPEVFRYFKERIRRIDRAHVISKEVMRFFSSSCPEILKARPVLRHPSKSACIARCFRVVGFRVVVWPQRIRGLPWLFGQTVF